MIGRLFSQISHSSISPNTAVTAGLSDWEREVLRLLARGLNNSDTAAHLHLSEGTVRNYPSAVLTKLGFPTGPRPRSWPYGMVWQI